MVGRVVCSGWSRCRAALGGLAVLLVGLSAGYIAEVEHWRVHSDEPLHEGDEVKVEGIESGLVLDVRRSGS